jgi:hypothetical protein
MMKRFLKIKLLALAVAIAAVGLAAGIAVAATQGGSGASSISAQVTTGNPEIVVEKQTVLEGKPAVTVLGAGWTPFTSAIVKIKIGGTDPDIVLGGVTTNKSGAFKLEVAELSKAITTGVYTVYAQATTSANEASAPLVVVKTK